jgi:hypothetical protein
MIDGLLLQKGKHDTRGDSRRRVSGNIVNQHVEFGLVEVPCALLSPDGNSIRTMDDGRTSVADKKILR